MDMHDLQTHLIGVAFTVSVRVRYSGALICLYYCIPYLLYLAQDKSSKYRSKNNLFLMAYLWAPLHPWPTPPFEEWFCPAPPSRSPDSLLVRCTPPQATFARRNGSTFLKDDIYSRCDARYTHLPILRVSLLHEVDELPQVAVCREEEDGIELLPDQQAAPGAKRQKHHC